MIDTNWEEICKKCNEEGLPNHIDCEYYGEPNGCNSPTYGRHPAYKRELGNVQKMREALEYVLLCDATDETAMEDGLTDADRIAEYADHIEECQKKAKAALAAPPRNCDRFNTWEEANKAFAKENAHRIGFMNLYTDVLKWLYASATEKEGGGE